MTAAIAAALARAYCNLVLVIMQQQRLAALVEARLSMI
jgi:hypothetical protein